MFVYILIAAVTLHHSLSYMQVSTISKHRHRATVPFTRLVVGT